MALGFNYWERLALALGPSQQTVIHNTAKAWQKAARAYAPVDTGFMQENIYVSDMQGSDYDSGSISPPGDSYLLPEEKPPDDMSAVVGCAANYSIYQEMGTRFMPPQPYFYPAGVEAQAVFEAEMKKTEDRLRNAIIGGVIRGIV